MNGNNKKKHSNEMSIDLKIYPYANSVSGNTVGSVKIEYDSGKLNTADQVDYFLNELSRYIETVKSNPEKLEYDKFFPADTTKIRFVPAKNKKNEIVNNPVAVTGLVNNQPVAKRTIAINSEAITSAATAVATAAAVVASKKST
jgi:hypothetical protein